MIERLFPLRSRIETGARVIKKRPIELLDINSDVEGIRISMDGNNTAVVLEGVVALYTAIAMLERLSGNTLQEKYLDTDMRSQIIIRMKNIIERFEQEWK